MRNEILIVLFCAIISIESVPKFDKPCKKGDGACLNKVLNELINAAYLGDASLKMDPLDPVLVDIIQGDLAAIKYKLFNTTVVGFKSCSISNAKLSGDRSQLDCTLSCASLDLKGDYDVNGDLLGLPVNGTGDYTVAATDYVIDFEGHLNEVTGKDGIKYIHFKNVKFTRSTLGGMKCRLNNLFGGQKDLSDTFHKFINENWNEVSMALQGPVFNVLIKLVVKNLNKVLKVVPLNTMYVEE